MVGIPAAIGAAIGASVPIRTKSKARKKNEKMTNILGGATTGALIGTMFLPSVMPASRGASRTRIGGYGSSGSLGGSSYGSIGSAYVPPPRARARARSTVNTPGFNWAWSPPTGRRPSSGAPSWRQAAAQGPQKPPPSGQRRAGPPPPPPPRSRAGAQRVKPPSEGQIVGSIARKMNLPKPATKAELNKTFRIEAKKIQGGETGIGGNADKMKDLSRWQAYYKTKVSSYHPLFQDGFVQEISKIASL